MQSILAILVTVTAFDAVKAFSLYKKDVPTVVALEISRNHVLDPAVRDLKRRRSMTVNETLDNEETLYFSNITLGTPAQKLRLTLDTGSSDLWCNTASSSFCSKKNSECSISGTYDANSSSTYKYLSSDFNISYVDGSGASGDYVTDTLSIGGVSLTSFQFGIGYTSDSIEGVLGIGYTKNEVQVNRDRKSSYPNLPQAMVDGGLINRNAYSLWLNDLDANTGSILFGGVDNGKYDGSLQTLPILAIDGSYAEFLIVLTGVSYNNGSINKSYSSDELPAAVLLDSGSSLTYLPDTIVEDIYNDFGVTYDSSSGTGYVPCTLMNKDLNITFTFSSPSITIAINEMVLAAGTGSTFSDGTPACVFGIAPAGSTTAVLGDTFLRSAYVVYDLANNEISLAQTKFNSAEENVVEIGSGTTAVPGATAVSNPVITVAGAGTATMTGSPETTVATSSNAASRSLTGDLGCLGAMVITTGFFLTL
ncbi:putative aspartic-type endopeptidase [Talaromyces proteolyticus]|uniref:Probable aspartic-type endopeptidase OPSB n=1 Tax=Talaromyces proteolyticus TaxID=1131652 RepID=A0AAD4PU56_9EURO|nr:putative aspartic-type endopeptidase [Talaromyces proteolyticus]KAH8689716.1 putative aspartic-type endopeptidase [Talaromyces proteolyticus]